MTTVSIKYCDIPAYLHVGAFYRNLNSDDVEEIIEVPASCFHLDGKVANNLEEFCLLLRVMGFWALTFIPRGVLDYCSKNDVSVWQGALHASTDATCVASALLTSFLKTGDIPLEEIIKTNRWEIIIHAVERMGRMSNATAIAAKLGNLRLLRLLHKHKFAWNSDTCGNASSWGHLECLMYAYENGCDWNDSTIVGAAGGGHIECMEYALAQGLEWSCNVTYYAAYFGQLCCLRYAYEHECPWDENTITAAVRQNQLDCLHFALVNGCPIPLDACSDACRNNNLAALQILHQFGAIWSTETAKQAASCPDSNCLQYLRENGCPWDEQVTTDAANEGNIPPLHYALYQGCPYPENLVFNAAVIPENRNSLACLKYLIEEQILDMDEDVFLYRLLHGDLECVQYLIDVGCPYLGAKLDEDSLDQLLDWQFAEGSLSCIVYAVERGWEPDKYFVDKLAAEDSACKEWFLNQGWRIAVADEDDDEDIEDNENDEGDEEEMMSSMTHCNIVHTIDGVSGTHYKRKYGQI